MPPLIVNFNNIRGFSKIPSDVYFQDPAKSLFFFNMRFWIIVSFPQWEKSTIAKPTVVYNMVNQLNDVWIKLY